MNMYMHLHPRARLIFISAVSLLLMVGAGFTFWHMARSVLWSGGAVLEIQSKIDGLARERIDAKVIERFLDERKEDHMRIKEFYADSDQPVAFLRDVEAFARATGNTLAIDLDEGGNDARHLGFRLALEGKEKDLLAYVRLLERAPYLVEIREVLYQNLALEESRRASSPPALFHITLRVRTR